MYTFKSKFTLAYGILPLQIALLCVFLFLIFLTTSAYCVFMSCLFLVSEDKTTFSLEGHSVYHLISSFVGKTPVNFLAFQSLCLAFGEQQATPDGLLDLIFMILLMLVGTDPSCQGLMQNVTDLASVT